MIPLPDPPLRWPGPIQPAVDALELVLRPWRPDDAPALAAAWADAEIQRWTGVPDQRDLAAADRWIAGDEVRRERELSLDLVVWRAGHLAGEVGLSALDRRAGTVEIGWWTMERDRGQGVASAASALLVAWASSTLGVAVVARCDPANPASVVVARRSGAMVLV